MAAPAPTLPDPAVMSDVLYAFTSTLSLKWTGMTDLSLWLVGYLSAWFLILMMIGSMSGVITAFGRMGEGLIKVVMLGWTLTHMNYFSDLFSRTLVTVGLFMGGNTMSVVDFMNPTRTLGLGWNTTGPIYAYAEQISSSWWTALMSIGSILIYDLLVLPCMWIAYFILSAQILLAIIEFKIVAIWAVIFLPTLIFKPTAWVGHGALHGLFDSAVRLGVLAFVVGVSMPWVSFVAFPPNSDVSIWNALTAGATSALVALIAWKTPHYAASLFAHGPAFTGSQLIGMGVGLAYGGIRAGRSMYAWGRA